MTALAKGIHGSVLDQLLDGVMVVERRGTITVFNPAAGRILGLKPEEVEGRAFGDVFIAREEFEPVTELLLAAISDGSASDTRVVVSLGAGDEARSLSVATSYLRTNEDGKAVPRALIAVFSDITELKELREAELRMARAMKAQHSELQTAYRQIDERNATLATMLKKVQVARIVATGLVISAFVGIGTYAWEPLNRPGGADGRSLGAQADAVEEPSTVVVEPGPVQESLALRGELAPWRTVSVVSPIESHVVAVHVQQGQHVEEGDLLVELDTAEAVREHRQAQLNHLEALAAFRTVRDWEHSSAMADANRSFTKAQFAVDSQASRLRRMAFLFEQGLIAASEHEDAERQYQNQLLDFEAARENLEATQARGSGEALEKATLALRSAEEVLREAEERAARGHVRAPITGVVLAARSSSRARLAATGMRVEQGTSLLAIGDFSRMAAMAAVDEVDVVRIAVGQQVAVTGNAYPDLQLRGAVTRVSSQPLPTSRGTPLFEVEVTLDPLEPIELAQLRTGMSSKLEIVVYRRDAALLVPITAVERRGGVHRVRLIEHSSGAVREREVAVGRTTMDSVEIVAGLKAGDEVVIPAH